jgi:dolichyl-phosphate-mannose--protein O-mannosyl transferase
MTRVPQQPQDQEAGADAAEPSTPAPQGEPTPSVTVPAEAADPPPATRSRRPNRPRPTPEPMPGEDPDEPTADRLTRRLLGADTLALTASGRERLLGWLGPIAVALLGGIVRFVNLGRPHALVFDETYYVKEGYSMMVRGYEAAWGDNPNPRFEAGDTSMLQHVAEYVVHPPIGKLLIGLGMQVGGGVTSSFAWRLSAAVVGTLAIVMVARIGRRIFASTALGTLAGLLLAVDGLAIVMSRTGLLDGFLMFFVLAAFGLLLLDRDLARRRLASRTAALLDAGRPLPAFGPRLGMRWWRLAAAVVLGLSCGTKWSGIYFLAVFGVVSVAWDVSARRTVGVRGWAAGGVLRDGVPAGFIMVSTAFVTYLASWTTWFASPQAWGRQWAVENPGQGVQWLPPALRSLWKFHEDMWQFHNNLTTPHAYAAHPIGWIVQWRPTSFYYPTSISGLSGEQAQAACGASSCSQPITSLGNPLIWWLGAAALLVATYWLITRRDWRAGAVLSGIAAGWLPWFAYEHRTIFTFYAIAFLPWLVLTLVYVASLVIGPKEGADPRDRRRAILWVAGVTALIVVVSAFFYPVWTAQVIPYDQWRLRMWLPSWI